MMFNITATSANMRDSQYARSVVKPQVFPASAKRALLLGLRTLALASPCSKGRDDRDVITLITLICINYGQEEVARSRHRSGSLQASESAHGSSLSQLDKEIHSLPSQTPSPRT